MVSEKVDANERIRETQRELGFDEEAKLPFLCECDDLTCRTLIRLTAAEYDTARADASRCVVCAGHSSQGRVVADGDGYTLVED